MTTTAHRRGALGRWSVRQTGPAPAGGVLEWTSPAGRTYRTVPDPSAGATAGGPFADVGERGGSVPEDADPPPF